jgi:poly(3-hydroxybutyrate) depolymerase
MAAILSATYPELYAAAGVHSGLPHGAAVDLPSAFAAMRGSKTPPASAAPRVSRAKMRVRTIVFHGASDKIVHPSNAEAIFADALVGLTDRAQDLILDGAAGGRAYTRSIVTDARGVPHAECWAIDGLGHAWSGGSLEGSFTDAKGPDASREILRFFLETQSQ